MYIFALLAALLVLSHAVVIRRDDAFYTPDDGWKNKNPGDILKWRKIKPQLLDQDVNVEEAYQVLYRTSHNHEDEPSHTVTTILVPHKAKKNKLVVGSTAQDANGKQCTPSASFTYASSENLVLMVDKYLFMPYLQDGYIMTVPDKEGPMNSFAAGLMEGHMVLDSIRATLNFEKIGLSKDAEVAGYGYSGGAISLGWAASLKGTYADELNVVGWAMGGTPVGLKETIDQMDGTPFAGLIVSGVAGVMDAYPGVKKEVEGHLTKEGKKAMEFAHKNCLVGVLGKYMFKSIYNGELQDAGAEIFEGEEVKKALRETHMGRENGPVPNAPVFMYHAKNDEVVPYKAARETAEMWCKKGAEVHMETYTHIEHGHFTTEITGGMPAQRFVKERLEGREWNGKCEFKDK